VKVIEERLATEPTHASMSLPPSNMAPRHISVLSAFMILTTWSTSSSNVLYPFCFGVLGALGGPLAMLVTFFISWRVTRWTIEAALATGADSFPDLGAALAGARGRWLFEGSQILFQQLFLPVAIVLCAGAVQDLAGVGEGGGGSFIACNGSVAVLLSLICFGLIQVSRELENVTALAYVSCALMLCMTAAVAMEVSTHAPPAADRISSIAAPVELFVGQGAHAERYFWANILSSLGIFVYSCLPCCIAVETMASLAPKDKPRMTRAVDASFVAYLSIYSIAGLPAVASWGGDLPEPISFKRTPLGVLVQVGQARARLRTRSLGNWAGLRTRSLHMMLTITLFALHTLSLL
jgi:hypothetical protein